MPENENEVVRATVERRLFQRAPVTVRVDYSTIDAMFSEFTRNINEGGLFVETEAPAEPGTAVELSFRLPGTRDPLKLEGRVVGEWVDVLRDACEADGGQLALDLSSVRFVSREGVALLRELRDRGVSLASPSP